MSTMYDSSGVYFPEEDSSDQIQYLEDSARSVELVREEGKDGQYSSFGFTLFQEKPPRIGAIVPGNIYVTDNVTTLWLQYNVVIHVVTRSCLVYL